MLLVGYWKTQNATSGDLPDISDSANNSGLIAKGFSLSDDRI